MSFQVLDEGDKPMPYYIIVVHPTDPRIPISGWVVSRRLTEFHLLQQRLKEVISTVWCNTSDGDLVSRPDFMGLGIVSVSSRSRSRLGLEV